MTMPTDSQIAAANASGTFPPEVNFLTDYGVGRCSAYQAVFRTDHVSTTHWAPMCFNFEIDRSFRERYPNLNANAAYNMRTDLTRPSGGGNTVLNLWIREGTNGGWTRLISIDMGMKEAVMFGNLSYMCRACNSAEVRTMEVSDMWARSLENGTWHAAKAVTPEIQGEWKGSCHFGADGSAAWAITSGVEGLCPKPESRRIELTHGNPPV